MYCVEMYGEVKPWGCKWFQLWRQHVKTAVARHQKLQVFYFNGLIGKGKIAGWGACSDDAVRRDSFLSKKAQFLAHLPEGEKERLAASSSEPRDDTQGAEPGSERADEEERLFLGSLSVPDRGFWVGHRGLGNSQKAEVAWLEKEGCEYEEKDVRSFTLQRQNSSFRRQRAMGLADGGLGLETETEAAVTPFSSLPQLEPYSSSTTQHKPETIKKSSVVPLALHTEMGQSLCVDKQA